MKKDYFLFANVSFIFWAISVHNTLIIFSLFALTYLGNLWLTTRNTVSLFRTLIPDEISVTGAYASWLTFELYVLLSLVNKLPIFAFNYKLWLYFTRLEYSAHKNRFRFSAAILYKPQLSHIFILACTFALIAITCSFPIIPYDSSYITELGRWQFVQDKRSGREIQGRAVVGSRSENLPVVIGMTWPRPPLATQL